MYIFSYYFTYITRLSSKQNRHILQSEKNNKFFFPPIFNIKINIEIKPNSSLLLKNCLNFYLNSTNLILGKNKISLLRLNLAYIPP